MKNTFSKLFDEMSPEARNAFQVGLPNLFGLTVFTVALTLFAVSTGAWQFAADAAVAGTLIIVSLFGLAMIRRGHWELGAGIAVYAFFPAIIMNSLLLSGLGLMTGIILAALAILKAPQALPRNKANWAIGIGIAAGVLTPLIDTFSLSFFTRIPAPNAFKVFTIIGAILITVPVAILAFKGSRNYSLRTKLISAFLAVTIVPLAIVSYVNNRSTTQSLVSAADVKIKSAAQSSADNVDSFISNALNETAVKAQDPEVIDYLLLPAGQRSGSEVEAQLFKVLAAFAHEDPKYINSIGVIDVNGNSLIDTSQAEIGVDKSQRIYFLEPMRTGQPYASEVLFSAVTGKPSLYFTAPVHNPVDNKIIGIFRVRYDASILSNIVEKFTGSIGNASLGVLLDENHIRLAHGELPELNYKTIVPLSADILTKLQADDRLPAGKTAQELSTNLPEFEAGLNNIVNKPFFIAELHTQGQGTEETTAVKLKTEPWTMVFGQTNTEFLAPIQTQTRNSLIIAFVLALVVAALGFFVAQSLTSPVLRLTAVASEIAGGNLSAQAQVESNDEIGALAGTFNKMSAQLKNTLDGLEQTVADRTQELEAAQAVMSKRALELQSVAEISTKASQATNPQDLLQTVVDLTKSSYNLYHAHIYLLDESKSKLVLAAGAGDVGRQMASEKRTIALDHPHSLVARAARTGAGAISNDVAQEPDFLPNPLLPLTKAEMAIPVAIAGQVLGVLDVQADYVNRFTSEDIAIKTTLAQQVATSLQNVYQYEETKSALSQSERLFSASERFARSKDLQDLTAAAVESLGVQEIDRAILGAITYGPNAEIDGMTIIANWSAGTGPQPTAIGTHYTKEMLRSISLFTSSEPLFFNDMLQDQRIDEVTFGIAKRANYRSLAALPLFIGSRQDGVLLLEGEKPHNFTQEEIRPFSAMAPQISTVLENRRQYEQAKKQAEREALLNTIGQKIQAATSVEAVVQIAARELGHAVGSKQTRVILKDYDSTAPHEK